MKLYQKLTVAAVAGFMSFSAASAEEKMGHQIASEILMNSGLTKEEAELALKNPEHKLGGTSVVCQACMQVEGWIGDPDKNCGGNNYSVTCGAYIVKKLIPYVQSNKNKACGAIAPHHDTICSESTTLGNGISKICGSSVFPGC